MWTSSRNVDCLPASPRGITTWPFEEINSSILFFRIFYCGKIHITQIIILTIFSRVVQGHCVHLLCCAVPTTIIFRTLHVKQKFCTYWTTHALLLEPPCSHFPAFCLWTSLANMCKWLYTVLASFVFVCFISFSIMSSKLLHAETNAMIFFLRPSNAPSHVIHFLIHSSLWTSCFQISVIVSDAAPVLLSVLLGLCP